jgi:hypothetical protein
LNTKTRGKKELLHPVESKPWRVREINRGPKWTEKKYPDIREHIRCIVGDNASGNHEKILSWTTDNLWDAFLPFSKLRIAGFAAGRDAGCDESASFCGAKLPSPKTTWMSFWGRARD